MDQSPFIGAPARSSALTFVTTTHPDQAKQEVIKKRVRSAAIRDHLEKNGPRRPRGPAKRKQHTRDAGSIAQKVMQPLSSNTKPPPSRKRSGRAFMPAAPVSRVAARSSTFQRDDASVSQELIQSQRSNTTELILQMYKNPVVRNPLPWSTEWPELIVYCT